MSDLHDRSEQANKHTPTSSSPDHREATADHGHELASAIGNAHATHVVQSTAVQRSGATGAQQLDESVARAIEDRRGRGRPLDDDVRSEMEGALGHDLSDVRVHTDSDAHALNEAVSARAFTTGDDVFFKQGTYAPESSAGKELLAHELTHVAQQRTGTSGLDAGEVSHPSDAAEHQAEAVGRRMASQESTVTAAAATAAPAGVAREAMPEEEEELQMATDPEATVLRQADEDLEDETA